MKNSATIFILLILLNGCAALEFGKMAFRVPLPVKQITIVSDENANKGFPIPVDIIIVHSEELVTVIAELDTDTWFGQRDFIMPQNLGQLEAVSYEVIVGAFEDPILFDWSDRKNARAVFVFANYIDTNVGKIRVDNIPTPVIHLAQGDIRVAR